MGLDSNGDLAIAELVYWVPALVLALYITFKHGFDRQAGWLFIVLMALARLIGASCTIADEEMTKPNSSVATAAAITNSIGVSFLIQAMLGMLTRVTSQLPKVTILHPTLLRGLHIVLLIGIVLGIVGGVKLSDGDPSDVSTGTDLLKASTILFLLGLLVVGAGLLITLTQRSSIPSGESRLIYAGLLASPFVFVRVLYSIISIFVQNDTFNYYHPSIWVRAFMAVLEEFIAAGIILAAGLFTQKKRDPALEELGLAQRPYGQEQQYGRNEAAYRGNNAV